MDKQKIALWDKTDKELKRLKKIESKLRDEIVEELFARREAGTHKAELGSGFVLSATIKNTVSVDEKALKDVVKQLPRNSKKKFIKTSVSLIKKGYDELCEEHREIVDECLILKPAKPSLKIVPPKEEKDD